MSQEKLQIQTHPQDLSIYFFLMWTPFLKFLLNFFITLLLFYISVFGQEACGILGPQPGIEPAPPALEVPSLNH